jgi:hypothetical protein
MKAAFPAPFTSKRPSPMGSVNQNLKMPFDLSDNRDDLSSTAALNGDLLMDGDGLILIVLA